MRNVRTTLIIICLFAAMNTQASTLYHMKNLGLLPGDGRGWATSINNAGIVVGASVPYGAGDTRGAFLWTSGSEMVDIRTENQFDLVADINNRGQTVGTANMGYGPTTAVLREPQGALLQLSSITEGVYGTYAYALNDNGWVVGTSDGYAVFWQGSITAQLIGGAPGSESYAVDINNADNIVWTESLHNNGQWVGTRSYVWSQGVSLLLQSLNSADDCQVESINDSGIAVGSSGNHAVVWGSDGNIMLDLGIGDAYGINGIGQIVGVRDNRAVMWNPDGSIAADLGALVGDGRSSIAYSINDLGQVVGGADYDAYGNMEAVLWQPVPEPTSLLALAAGIAGLVIRRRR